MKRSSLHADAPPTPLPCAKYLDEGGEMLLVSWTRVEPGKIQPIKAMGPQEWGNRLDEGPASLRVGGNPGESRTKPAQNLGAGGLNCQI